MDVKITVKPMRKAEIPSAKYTPDCCMYEQFLGIVEEFWKSESECVSLLPGDPVDSKVLHNLQGHLQKAAKVLGLEDSIKVTIRARANNVYLVKEGE